MIGKLLVIGIIVSVVAVLAYTQQDKLGFNVNPAINAVAEDLDGLKDTTINRVSHEVDKTGDAVSDTINEQIDDVIPTAEKLNPIPAIQNTIAVPPQVYTGQVYETDETQNTCKISVPKMAKTVNGQKELTHTIELDDCKYEKNAPVNVTVLTNPTTGDQTVTVTPIPQSKIFQTLQLTTTKNADNTVGIHYEDSSGKTLKVTVTLSNSDKQLFSGEFFASKFDTSVGDVSDTPHVIEMIVEHAEYGTVNSSVYNPQGNNESTIYGVFSQ